jgi:hypothetical protein
LSASVGSGEVRLWPGARERWSGGSRRPYTGWSRFYTPRRRECGLEGGVWEHGLEGGGVIGRDVEGDVWVRGPEGSNVRERGLEGGNVRERGMDCGVLP